jgi:hypothetical protein
MIPPRITRMFRKFWLSYSTVTNTTSDKNHRAAFSHIVAGAGLQLQSQEMNDGFEKHFADIYFGVLSVFGGFRLGASKRAQPELSPPGY